jgi:hypothetical protein
MFHAAGRLLSGFFFPKRRIIIEEAENREEVK